MREVMTGTDPDTGVPCGLLEFNRALRVPEGGPALGPLVGFDDYINQDGPSRERVAEITRAVPVREVAGWKVTTDVYRPVGDPPYPTLLFLHGGAWIAGTPGTHRRLAADLCALGMLTVVLDYRRAPRHRFPAAVLDTLHALDWVATQAASHGGDPERLWIGGDSAGANLAAAALAAGAPVPVAGALLAYGIFDVHRALPTLAGVLGGPDADTQLYLQPDDARGLVDDPRLHPERHCAGFPPTLVLSGDDDPLHPESTALAARLADAGVPHRYVVVAGAPHGFLQLPTHPAHELGLRAIREFLADFSRAPAGPVITERVIADQKGVT